MAKSFVELTTCTCGENPALCEVHRGPTKKELAQQEVARMLGNACATPWGRMMIARAGDYSAR